VKPKYRTSRYVPVSRVSGYFLKILKVHFSLFLMKNYNLPIPSVPDHFQRTILTAPSRTAWSTPTSGICKQRSTLSVRASFTKLGTGQAGHTRHAHVPPLVDLTFWFDKLKASTETSFSKNTQQRLVRKWVVFVTLLRSFFYNKDLQKLIFGFKRSTTT